ncbi:MAG: GNAT family N-acetyltransferase [Bacillota bacterium]|nr:GNAT family N-acetyltransferase [Bacillota bacterium]
MFRKAYMDDLDKISAIYDEIHTEEESGKVSIGWIRGIYPTEQTAYDSILKGDMFVETDNGNIVAAAKINKEQVPEYSDAKWIYEVPDELIMVLHTLVVSPKYKGCGYGTAFVDFYENYALTNGCSYLRMDTNEKNANARRLYKKLGYTEVSVVDCCFNGIDGVRLVCLEKKIQHHED